MKAYKNFDLTNYNGYRVKSRCMNAFFPQNEQDIIELYNKKSNYILLGSGHNIILSKDYYNQDFIIFNGNFNKVEANLNQINAEAGATIQKISETAEENGLKGLEFFYDIPSSIGGAVVMNAGTKEGETKNFLYKVRYLDLKSMSIKEKLKHDLDLDYRTSIFQQKKYKIILKAWFNLPKGDPSEIRKIMNSSKDRRWSKQPRDFPNCGSVFKRPPGMFVGPMIDDLGLRGYNIGGAQISKKHSGFIINIGGATGEDILKLIKYIQQKVKAKFNIELKVEQRII